MMTNNELSLLYAKRQIRVSIHVLFWGCVFIFLCFFNHLPLFNTTSFSRISLLSNATFLVAIMLNHYFFFIIVLPLIRRKKWLLLALAVGSGYISSIYLATVPLWISQMAYPDNKAYLAKLNFYGVRSWSDLFSYGPMIWAFTTIFFYNFATILLKTALDFYKSQREKLSAQKERNLMELHFLKMQIQPHFLFNTLNNIYGMVIDNELAANSITRLSDLLRFSITGSKKDWILLKEEVGFLTDYINLEKIRHKPEKLQMEVDFHQVSESELKIRPLLLINFIENAFKHGVNSSTSTSWVAASLVEKDGLLKFIVRNSKPVVVPKDKKEDERRALRHTHDGGIGLINVRRRLELEYPEKHTLSSRETDTEYSVELVLDLR